MANTTINGTQLIQNNMPVQPTTIITIVAVFFVLALAIGIGVWLWNYFR